MPHPRADLLPQMPHPGEDKVVKCPTNTAEGMRVVGIDGAIIRQVELLLTVCSFVNVVF